MTERNNRDLAMMRDPTRWPCGNVLPLKKYVPRKDYGMDLECANLVNRSPLFQFIHEDPAISSKFGGDQLLLNLIEEGWMVD